MTNIRRTSLLLSVLLAGGVASMPSSAATAAARTVRVCTFPGSPTRALDTAVARAVFGLAGIAATFDENRIQERGDDGVSAHELADTLTRDCDVIAGLPVPSGGGSAGSHMVYSQPYLHSGYVSITLRGAAASAIGKDATVAATYSSLSQLIAVEQRYQHFALENTPEQTIDAVTANRAQRAIVWYPAVVTYEQSHPDLHFDVTPVASAYSDWNLVLALGPGSMKLQQRINAALTALRKNGHLSELTHDWALPGKAATTAADRKPGASQMASGIHTAVYTPSEAGSIIKVSGKAAASPSTDGVPSFDKAQAAHGKALYAQHCAKCHGNDMQGKIGPALRGPVFAPTNSHILVSGMYQFISNNMPADRPGQLKEGQYADLMAFLLYENGYDAGTNHLTARIANASMAPLNAGPRPH
jgi:mono/diheme cytochrome c family protein